MADQNININDVNEKNIPVSKRGRKSNPNKITADIKKYKAEYYEKNKNKVLAFHSKTINCPICDKSIKYSSKSAHLRNVCKAPNTN